MPEGDTIAHAANRMRPVLAGRVPDQIETPQRRHALDRWPARLAGRAISSVDTYGKHLFLRFDGDLAIHSHLGMSGMWGVYGERRWSRSSGRAWIVFRCADVEVVEFDGPLLELITSARMSLDQRLSGLGPDVLAPEFDGQKFLSRLRSDERTRTIGDALLDQRNVAGIGNIWKAEGCWEVGVDPWRKLEGISNDQALAIIGALRPRMLRSAEQGPRAIQARVYGRAGRPCPRCGARLSARGQGDANRTTYWCPGCQT